MGIAYNQIDINLIFNLSDLKRMKLFTTLAASAVAQLNIGSLDDLFNQLNAGLPASDVADEGPIEGIGERYFAAAGTQATTTTPIPTLPVETQTVYGTGCWKCDAMSYTTCASEGYWQDCSNDQAAGDSGVCFIEMRETSQELTQLCTGCKDAQACDDLKKQNFVYGGGSRTDARNQCKSDWRMQRPSRRRYGVMQSTCRQCFSMCLDLGQDNTDAVNDTNGNYCFGGLSNEDVQPDLSDADQAAWFKVPTGMSQYATTAGQGTLDQYSLGIPLQAVVGVSEAGKITSTNNKVMWGNTYDSGNLASGSGKNAAGVAVGPVTLASGNIQGYLFWSLHDHAMDFWSMDIVERQRINRFWMNQRFDEINGIVSDNILMASTDDAVTQLLDTELDSQ